MAGDSQINVSVLLRFLADEARRQMTATGSDLRALGGAAGEAGQGATTAGGAIDKAGTAAQGASGAFSATNATLSETVATASNMTAELGRAALSTASTRDVVTGLGAATESATLPMNAFAGSLETTRSALGAALTAANGFSLSVGEQTDALLRHSQATNAWQTQLDGVRAKFNPLFAASRQYEMELRAIAEAEEMNAISATEAMAARERAAQAMAPMPGMARQYGAAVNQAAGYSANLFSQWNDIAVMMAAGQNPMQLALQQGTQVSQVLMQLGGGTTALRAVGASFLAMLNPISLATIGIIAFGAAGMQWLGRLGGESRSFDDSLNDLNTTLGRMRTNLDLLGDTRLEDTFGSLTGSVRGLAQGMLELDRASEFQQFADVFDGFLNSEEMEESFGQLLSRSFSVGMGAAMGDGGNFGLGQTSLDLKRNNIATNYRNLGAANSYNDFERRATELKELAESGDIEAVNKALVELQQAMAGGGSFTGMKQELRDLWAELSKTGIGVAKLEAIFNGSAKAAAIEHQIDKMVEGYSRQSELAEVALRFGEDSAQVDEVRARQAREALRLKLEEMDVDEQSADAVRARAALEEKLAADAAAAQDRRIKAHADVISGLTQQLELTTAIQRHGADAAEVEALRAQHAWEVQEARLQEMGLGPQLIAQAQELFDLERQRAAEIRKAASAKQAADLLADLREEAEINAAILRYGEDSLQVKELQIAAERRAFEQSLATMQVTEQLKEELLATWDAARGMASADPFGSFAAARSYIRDQQERIDKLQLEQSLLGQNEAIRSRIVALWEVERVIRREGIDATSARASEMRALAVQEAELASSIERQKEAWGAVQSAAESAIDSIVDSLTKGDIEGALAGLSDTITATFSELSIANPLKNAILGTDLGTLDDLGGLEGIWARLTGRGEVPSISPAATYSAASMNVTAGTVTVSGGFGFAAAGQVPGAAAGNAPAAAANVNVPSGDWLRYANQGAIRDKPISDRLKRALSFLDEMGIRMEVFSGGQDALGSGGARIGSTRHDHGDAADALFYKDGRRLDWRNPADVPLFEEIVSRARANGVTGFGAGPGYMQPGSMHIGYGTSAVWGADGAGQNAPEWLRRAFSTPWTNAMGTDRMTDAGDSAVKTLASFSSATETATQDLGTLGGGFDAFGQLLTGLGAGAGQGAGGTGGLLWSLASAFAGGLGIPGFATGGHHTGGLRIVSEDGPELEYTGPSTILPADLTRSVLAARPPNITVNATSSETPMGAAFGKLPIVVNDYSGQGVDAEVQPDGRGGRQLLMSVGQQGAAAMAQPGNPMRKQLRRMGVRNGPTKR
ncbi:phage tail length tape measure family protein [Marinovum sp. F03]|uniref:phage tail length tape measure family protein n=1 Tax=Marinovum sp. F03 TaxID=3449226 RepID=UPI003EDC8D15